jgi:hypothetical protein
VAEKAQQTNTEKKKVRGQRPTGPVAQGPVALVQEADAVVLQRAMANPAEVSPAGILALQSAAGNRAVTGLIQARMMGGERAIQQPAGPGQIRRQPEVPGFLRSALAERRAAMGYEEEETGTEPLPGTEAQGTRPQAYTGQDLLEKQEAAARLAAVMNPRSQPGPALAPTGGWNRGVHGPMPRTTAGLLGSRSGPGAPVPAPVPPAGWSQGVHGPMPRTAAGLLGSRSGPGAPAPSTGVAPGLLGIGGANPPSASQLAGVKLEGEGGRLDAASALSSWAGSAVNAADEILVDRYRGQELKAEGLGESVVIPEGAAWAAGGALGAFSGILGMAKSMKDLFATDADAWQRVQAVFGLLTSSSDFVGSSAGIAGGVSQIVGQVKGSDLASESSSWFLGYQEMFSTLTSAISTVKGAVGLVHMAFLQRKKGQAHGKEEWAQAWSGVVTGALATVKGVVKSIRAIHEALGGAIDSAASKVLSTVAVGFDIAIAAIKSIMQGYYLIKSAVQLSRMQKRKGEIEAKLVRKGGHSRDELKEAVKFYGEREGMLATLDDLIAKNEQTIEEEKKQQGRWTRFKSRVRDPKEKIAQLEEQNKTYRANKIKIEAETRAREKGRLFPHAADVAELGLAGELRWVNQKRIVRQSVHITTNLVQIGASIATIVSGPGAPAAIALKATAAGIDTSLPFFRWVKQKSRDVAAKQAATKGEVTNKLFRVDKSSAAKLQARKKQAVMVLMMAVKLNDYMPKGASPTPEEVRRLQKHAGRVESYIRATGCSPKKLYRANGNPQEQVKILVKELARRELGED